MIASALRAEIERSVHRVRGLSGAAPWRDEQSVSGGNGRTGSTAPIDTSSCTAASLARRALLLQLSVVQGSAFVQMLEERAGVPRQTWSCGVGRDECLQLLEEIFDAIDALVEDPAELPVLREEIRRASSQLEILCFGFLRSNRNHDFHISAA